MRPKIFPILFILVSLLPIVIAQADAEEIGLLGFELEKVIIFINALISTFLFVLAFTAYKRENRKRILFVSIAFLLFAIKSFLISSELFIEEIPYIDPIAVVLEFAALLSLFYGVLKK